MTDNTTFTYVLNEGLRLLVVDDDPIQREFSVVYLAAPGVEVVTAASGEEAATLLNERSFDVALVDYDMPGMSGVDLVKQMRRDAKLATMPVILITGREDMASIDAAYNAGATSFMCKPINWRLLSYQIRFVMRAHALDARA